MVRIWVSVNVQVENVVCGGHVCSLWCIFGSGVLGGFQHCHDRLSQHILTLVDFFFM